MFEWLKNIFSNSTSNIKQQFFRMLDSENAKLAGGEPRIITQHLGELHLRSNSILLGDPQDVNSLEIANIDVNTLNIFATLKWYPNGTTSVIGLNIELGEQNELGPKQMIGKLGIDSARMVVVDKIDFEQHWTETGKDRIGYIKTLNGKDVLQLLCQKFKFKTVQEGIIRARILGDVSVEVEAEVIAYLQTFPKYADYTFMYFNVQTNNSFDRVNFSERSWEFLPVGNENIPLMFTCNTGRGDGSYAVYCQFASSYPRKISIDFLEE